MRKRLVVWMVLVFCSVAWQNAMASSNLGLRSIGADIGFVDPDDIDGTFGFGAFANMGNISRDFRLYPHLGYWSKSMDLGGGSEASFRDISLVPRGVYMFRGTSPKFQPYVGAGLGLHMAHAKVSFPAQDLGGGLIIPAYEASDTETKVGLDMGGGFITPLSRSNDLYVDLWYSAVSDVGHIQMKVGISFDLNSGSESKSTRPSGTRSRTRR